jgi:hypothetical protein
MIREQVLGTEQALRGLPNPSFGDERSLDLDPPHLMD